MSVPPAPSRLALALLSAVAVSAALLGSCSTVSPERQASAAAATAAALGAHLDRTVDEVDAIERAALRIAVYELLHRPDVPYRVVINEAIDSTKRFGSEHGHTFVNGVLDHAAAAWRAAEAQASRRS